MRSLALFVVVVFALCSHQAAAEDDVVQTDEELARILQLQEVGKAVLEAKLPGTVGVQVERDTEGSKTSKKGSVEQPNSAKNTEWKHVLTILWNPDFDGKTAPAGHGSKVKGDSGSSGSKAAARSLGDISKLLKEYFDKVKEIKGIKDFIAHVQVIWSGVPDQEMDMAAARRIALKHKFKNQGRQRATTRDVADPFTGGESWLRRCVTSNYDFGTPGGILVDNASPKKHYVLSNSHVLGTKLTGASAGCTPIAAAVWHQAADPIPAGTLGTDYQSLGTALDDLAATTPKFDAAAVKITSGKKIQCKRATPTGYKAVAGVRAQPNKPKGGGKIPWEDIEGWWVEKRGMRTQFTKGKIIGWYTGVGASQWGWIVEGTWPNFPANAVVQELRSPYEMACRTSTHVDCQAGHKYATQCADETCAATNDWDSKVFSAGGDSGSIVYDSTDKAVGLLWGGTWQLKTGVLKKVTYVYPFQMVLDEYNSQVGPGRVMSICTDASTSITTS